ncbi:MAG TPA: hypothetical protein VEY68_06915 [Anoxybacillus sp.]|nr:hypothetical protein [Anoxybacillus sp.]
METQKILTEANLEKMKRQNEEIRTAIASVQRQLEEINSKLLDLQKHQELTTYEQCPLCKQTLSNEYRLSLKKEATVSTEQLLLEKETLEQKEELLNRELKELTMKIEQLQLESQKQNERIEQAKIQQNSQMLAKQLQQKKMEIIDTLKSKKINIQTIKAEMKLLKHQLAQVFSNIQNMINNELSDSQILLFKRLKSGELRPDFQIFYKNKPYRVLSYSEKIRCMVEISSIIQHFSNRCYPIFLDNLESVTHLNPPKTQIFTASVRKGAPLQLHAK